MPLDNPCRYCVITLTVLVGCLLALGSVGCVQDVRQAHDPHVAQATLAPHIAPESLPTSHLPGLAAPVPSLTATEAAALPTVTPKSNALPTVTPEPTAPPVPASVTPQATAVAAPASPTVEPTATDSPSAAPMRLSTPRPTTEAQAVAAAPAAPKPVVARPRGRPLAYEPQFPSVSPAGDPPAYDGHTNPLSGIRVDDSALIQRRPLLVRYGNDRAARPHAGISQAELVMEDVMDAWWITRLTAVFLQAEPTKVGPLRSARPVNVEVLPAFDGVLVFSGASIGVNQLLAQQPFDLIHEDLDGDLLYRSSDRLAPHNLYTSIPDIRARLRAQGRERAVDLRGFAFSGDAPPGPAAARVDIPYPSSSTVAWTYDGGVGLYRRWVQGQPYVDQVTGQQVGCENVIVLYARHWETDIVEDSYGSTSIGIALRGGERVQILRDGRVLEGFWWRREAHRLWQFVDANGQHIPLKPGHTWIQFVPTSYAVDVS